MILPEDVLGSLSFSILKSVQTSAQVNALAIRDAIHIAVTSLRCVLILEICDPLLYSVTVVWVGNEESGDTVRSIRIALLLLLLANQSMLTKI